MALVGGCVVLGRLLPDTPPPPPPKPTIDKSPEMQAKRLALIQELVDKGVFYKVEKPGSVPHVYVTAVFRAIPFDAKQNFVGTVYGYYFDGSNFMDNVVLRDALSGKQVGSFSKDSGLELDEPDR